MGMGSANTQFRGRRRRIGGNFSEINVTPMVDVMLVLLIVFMVAAPMLTVGVPVDLPKTKAAKMNDQVEPVVVSVDSSGHTFLQETAVGDEGLVARLMAITSNNPDARIYVRGDQGLAYGRVMEVMGEIAAAGFTKVSLIAEMPKPTTAVPQPTPKNHPQPLRPRPLQRTTQDVPTLQQLIPPANQAAQADNRQNQGSTRQHLQRNNRPIHNQRQLIQG